MGAAVVGSVVPHWTINRRVTGSNLPDDMFCKSRFYEESFISLFEKFLSLSLMSRVTVYVFSVHLGGDLLN